MNYESSHVQGIKYRYVYIYMEFGIRIWFSMEETGSRLPSPISLGRSRDQDEPEATTTLIFPSSSFLNVSLVASRRLRKP